jgi:hypothetical protein
LTFGACYNTTGVQKCAKQSKKNFPHLGLNIPPYASYISALPLSYCLFAWKVRSVLGISKERKGFTELLRNCPEYSGDFLNVKEIPPLNLLRRIP